MRRALITSEEKLPSTRQCQLLDVACLSVYYHPVPISGQELAIMARIDRIHTDLPFLGSGRIADELRDHGVVVNRKRLRRLMGIMGGTALYPKKRTTVPHPGHKIYPYLLRELNIDHPGHVWAAHITYIPKAKGFLYLVAIMDW